MGRIKSNDKMFEIWDGGHCYVRLFRRADPDTVSVERMSPGIRAAELTAMAEWAKLTVPSEQGDDDLALAIDNDQALLRRALGLAREHPERERLSYFLFYMAMTEPQLRKLLPLHRNGTAVTIENHWLVPEYWKWLADQYITKVQEGS